jgi:hypothetical protein
MSACDGLPFFEKLGQDVPLHLADVKGYKSGVVELRYEVRQHGGASPFAATSDSRDRRKAVKRARSLTAG